MDRIQHQLIAGVTAGALAALMGLAACGRDASARGTETVVDSAVPRDVALARFRDGLTEVRALHGGAGSREALVRQFVQALAARDTALLRSLTMDRAEFAWLYYPTTPQGLPPYDLAPGLMWSMLELRSRSGAAHALEEYGGRPLRYRSHSCEEHVSREGRNTLYGPCTLRLSVAGERVEQRLFGLIIRRDGRFKFVSLANKLD